MRPTAANLAQHRRSRPPRRLPPRRTQVGLSLIELMIALVLGLLLTAGIITLFSGTSKSSRVQDGLARLQENGRYAMGRIDADLRMVAGQYCSQFAGVALQTGNGPLLALRAPWMYAGSMTLPDAGSFAYSTPTAIDPALFVQGYECTSGTCDPELPSGAGQIPDVGEDAGDRLRGTDVLTIRYLDGSGWPVTAIASTDVPPTPECKTGSTITVSPQTGDPAFDDAGHAFEAGDLAYISDCQNPSILPVASAASGVVTLGTVLAEDGKGPACSAGANRDTRLFNFSKDFVTVSYFIKLAEDRNPDAAGRLIPVLVRRINGVDQELVQGVERLDFLYGVNDEDGAVRYLDADEIEGLAASNCPPAPEGLSNGAGCMWRSVGSIEVHALLNTVDDIGVSGEEMAFRYSIDSDAIAPPSGDSSTVTGLPFGRMMRREFVSLVSARNYNR